MTLEKTMDDYIKRIESGDLSVFDEPNFNATLNEWMKNPIEKDDTRVVDGLIKMNEKEQEKNKETSSEE